MKNEVINLIKILGITVYELVIEIDLGEYVCDSIEYVPESNKVVLHVWLDGDDGEDYEYDIDFESLSTKYQKKILTTLSNLCMN